MSKNKVINNYLLHIFNGLIPFLLISILTFSYPLSFLGDYFYFFTLISITQIFIDYSFSFSALRRYKEMQLTNKSLNDKINLFLNVILSKFILSLAFIFIVFIILFFFQVEVEKYYTPIFYFSLVLGVVLSLSNFTWFFYATEHSFKYSLLLLVIRFLFLLPLLQIHPIQLVLFVTIFPVFISNVLLIFFLIYNSKLIFKNFKFSFEVFNLLYAGRKIFINNVIISAIIGSWPLVFKVFLSTEQIGIFGIADKIVKGLMSLVTPLPNFLLSNPSKVKLFLLNELSFKNISLSFFIIFLIPFFFIILPDFILAKVIGTEILSNRFVLNFYSISFISGTINIILYTILIIYCREIEYLFSFFFSIIFIVIYTFIFGFSIYQPIVFDVTLAIFMLINFFKNKLFKVAVNL